PYLEPAGVALPGVAPSLRHRRHPRTPPADRGRRGRPPSAGDRRRPARAGPRRPGPRGVGTGGAGGVAVAVALRGATLGGVWRGLCARGARSCRLPVWIAQRAHRGGASMTEAGTPGTAARAADPHAVSSGGSTASAEGLVK